MLCYLEGSELTVNMKPQSWLSCLEQAVKMGGMGAGLSKKNSLKNPGLVIQDSELDTTQALVAKQELDTGKNCL